LAVDELERCVDGPEGASLQRAGRSALSRLSVGERLLPAAVLNGRVVVAAGALSGVPDLYGLLNPLPETGDPPGSGVGSPGRRAEE